MKKILTTSLFVCLLISVATVSKGSEYDLDDLVTEQVKSQNFVDKHLDPKTVVLHSYGFSYHWVKHYYSLNIKNGGAGAAAHLVISPDGSKCMQMVDLDKPADHAGPSRWKTWERLNPCSLGIEVGCHEYGILPKLKLPEKEKTHLNEGEFYDFAPYSFKPFEQDAIDRLTKVCGRLKFEPEDYVWHSDISAFRINKADKVILGKTDPGPLFPAEELAKIGIGIFPLADREDDSQLDFSLESLTGLLAKFGYVFDSENPLQVSYTVQAFLMHYCPKRIKWSEFEQQKSGLVWDCTQNEVTDNMVIRAHNLVHNIVIDVDK